ncbi:MAG: hypothetical protein Q7R65_04775 [bacterium]|nr:hypothetical protein [bacterium]
MGKVKGQFFVFYIIFPLLHNLPPSNFKNAIAILKLDGEYDWLTNEVIISSLVVRKSRLKTVMNDTLPELKITQPLPVKGLGRLFWSESYMSKQIPVGVDAGNFSALTVFPWMRHYSVPSPSDTFDSWSFAVDLEINERDRPIGRECIEIDVDYLMGQLEWRCNNNEGQGVVLDSLRLRKLFSSLKKLVVELGCEHVLCLYDPVEFDGDHRVYVDFHHCLKLPAWQPDVLLPHLAERFEQLLQTA